MASPKGLYGGQMRMQPAGGLVVVGDNHPGFEESDFAADRNETKEVSSVLESTTENVILAADLSAPEDAIMHEFFALTADNIQAKYLDKQQKGDLVSLKLADDLTKIFERYIENIGGLASEAVFDKIGLIAENYEKFFTGTDIKDKYEDPEAILRRAQMFSLLSSPVFMGDVRSLLVIKKFADLAPQARTPWTVDMYADFDEEESEEYILREGFGEEHLLVFGLLANDKKLWAGKCEPMQHDFLSSVAQALRLIASKYPKLLIDTVQPRLNILNNNKAGANYRLLREEASFRPNELEQLSKLVTDQNQAALNAKIAEAKENLFDESEE